MSFTLLQAYHLLPNSLRSVVASARGLYLRSWRYGSETQRLVEEANEREFWSAEQWMSWREERLAFTLRRAATTVPYYRDLWARRRARGDRSSWEYLENWPILEKDPVRKNPKAFVAEDCQIGKMFHEHTSGTTGKPINLWWSRETVREWYALFEARTRGWYGVTRDDRWAMLGGQLVVPRNQRRPPFWIWNSAFNQLYMSSYHLSPEFIPYYLDALKQYKIKYLFGYTSSLYALAQEGARQGRTDLEMLAAITNAEPVYPYQRNTMVDTFQGPVSETYGMAELVGSGNECRFGKMHLWSDVGLMEIMNENKVVDDSLSGELICTGLLNIDMPLVRYHVGDRGTLEQPGSSCACGRTLPIMAAIEGRVDDTLYTPDGRPVGRLDTVFKGDLPIQEAQIIQETLGRVHLFYVPADHFSNGTKHTLIDRIQERMGSVEVILEEVSEVPREGNGKFRAVVCNISEHELQQCLTAEKK